MYGDMPWPPAAECNMITNKQNDSGMSALDLFLLRKVICSTSKQVNIQDIELRKRAD